MNEGKKKSLNLIIISFVLVCLLSFGGGIIIGKTFFGEKITEIKEQEESEETEETEETIIEKDVLPEELSEAMIYFMDHNTADGSNILAAAGRRKRFVNISLKGVSQQTPETNMQPVGYVDYDVYKAKYNEIYGDNYNLDEDLNESTSGGPDNTNFCDNYPSLVGKNVLCWSLDTGTSGTRDYVLINKTKENNQYTMDGTYSVSYPSGGVDNGTFVIVYTIKDHKAYLKSLTLTKN